MNIKSLFKGLIATTAMTASVITLAGYEATHIYSSGNMSIIQYVEGYEENPDKDTFSVVHDEAAQIVTISTKEIYRDQSTGEILSEREYSCDITPSSFNGTDYFYDDAVELAQNLHLVDQFIVHFYGVHPCQDLFGIEYRNWRRTLVFIYGETQPGQDMFIRGGIDHNYAQNNLGRNCTSENYECAIPIRHLNLRNNTTAPWKSGDNYLDWYGAEAAQSSESEGSALDWTTDFWPEAWGAARTYEIDGSGETPLNTYGQHYWLLEVEMDCSATASGWFELKSYISNGPGWESDAQQAGAPWYSGNHFAKCGELNVFRRGQSEPVTIEAL